MLKVIDLLSLKEFESFKLVSDTSGLYNNVSSTSILDWESPADIDRDFRAEDFVFITLYMTGSTPDDMDARYRALFNKNVAAIGIKVADYDSFTVPDDILAKANAHRIPIFLYTEAYLEDLIFTIRSAVFYNDANRVSLDYLRFLMESGEDMTVSIARKLNPLFNDNILCCCCIPVTDNAEPVLERALEEYRKTLTHNLYIYKSGDALIKCSRCIMIIYTSESEIDESVDSLKKILSDFMVEQEKFAIGFSDVKPALKLLREAVTEAMNAALSALINDESQRRFRDVGIDGLVLPNLESGRHTDFYRRTLSLLEGYDAEHASSLLDTLLCYVRCHGDVAKTAAELYQHGNTIRYRLNKIRELLGISNSADSYVPLYIFAKMHRIYSILDEEPLI